MALKTSFSVGNRLMRRKCFPDDSCRLSVLGPFTGKSVDQEPRTENRIFSACLATQGISHVSVNFLSAPGFQESNETRPRRDSCHSPMRN